MPRDFHSRYVKGPGCWEWQDARTSGGYGELMVAGRMWTAHRYAWTLANGPIPKRRWVLHHCNNRPCVRPDHLYVGTPTDNARDRQRAGTAVGGGVSGERQWNAKLHAATVLELRRRVTAGESVTGVASALGVGVANAYRIAEGRSWKHLL